MDLLERNAPTLTPSEDRRPVELALAESILTVHEPETFLAVTFYRPDGGCRVRYAWTAGGADLGDRIDVLARGLGLDAADNFHITDLHVRTTSRGRVEIHAHPLRPILADVEAGVRSPEERRAKLREFIAIAARETGQTPRRTSFPWLGVGPRLINQR
ncbi:hypothetical protein JHN59_37030 [Streptomyces sp. MBT49]|uniref:hypothetical protein n=1 Tax=unclassified Streptomyces TaxID=2593676 RepID=UPI00190DD581|nr:MULTISPECIES: hypothetical protein [unclassified Streptomyces]MBK3630305.1 hypothetical protein [Streptomyces sp. MBT49]MBK3634692.1 hypothetical protein [Streptomyces sp. MBT97]